MQNTHFQRQWRDGWKHLFFFQEGFNALCLVSPPCVAAKFAFSTQRGVDTGSGTTNHQKFGWKEEVMDFSPFAPSSKIEPDRDNGGARKSPLQLNFRGKNFPSSKAKVEEALWDAAGSGTPPPGASRVSPTTTRQKVPLSPNPKTQSDSSRARQNFNAREGEIFLSAPPFLTQP